MKGREGEGGRRRGRERVCVVQFYLLYAPFKVSANAQVLQSEIVGSVKMNVHLTGMPELRLGLNDKILFENTGRKIMIMNVMLMIISSK